MCFKNKIVINRLDYVENVCLKKNDMILFFPNQLYFERYFNKSSLKKPHKMINN